jgi:hypothetical protein
MPIVCQLYFPDVALFQWPKKSESEVRPGEGMFALSKHDEARGGYRAHNLRKWTTLMGWWMAR